jgi:Na+-driven multidrug efflux pump
MILPLVLVNTVIGGSSAVGRSILLGMGRVRIFSIAVIIAGVTNVLFSYIFVKYCHLGLKGIVLGTIVAVVARCLLWMPWYVLRTLRRGSNIEMDRAEATASRGFDVVPLE